MPRVHSVKKARKDNPAVKTGEPYYWWKFRDGQMHYSATPPRQSQLTSSEYLATFYGLQERIEDLTNDAEATLVDFADTLREVHGDLEALSSDTEEKADNVEEHFPGGSPVLELLRPRVEGCEVTAQSVEEAADAVDTLIDEVNAGEKDEAKAREEAVEALQRIEWQEDA